MPRFFPSPDPTHVGASGTRSAPFKYQLSQYVPVQLHKEGLQGPTHADFLRGMDIRCDDSGLKLTQILELQLHMLRTTIAVPNNHNLHC